MTDILQSPELQAALTNFVIALISIILPVIAERITTFVSGKIAEGKAQLSASQLAILNMVTEMVVQSVEQAVKNGTLGTAAKAKKAKAIARIRKHLNALGLSHIGLEAIEDAIEAAIKKGVHKGYPDFPLVETIALED